MFGAFSTSSDWKPPTLVDGRSEGAAAAAQAASLYPPSRGPQSFATPSNCSLDYFRRPRHHRAMLDVIEKLLTLQDRDQRLRSFQTELAHLPEERKTREKQIADSAAQLDTAKIRAKEIEIEKRNLEMEARTKTETPSPATGNSSSKPEKTKNTQRSPTRLPPPKRPSSPWKIESSI